MTVSKGAPYCMVSVKTVIDQSMTLFEWAILEQSLNNEWQFLKVHLTAGSQRKLSLTSQWHFLKVHLTAGSRGKLSLTSQWHFLNELLQNCHWPVNKRKWRQFNTDYFIASPIAECGHGSEKTTMKADCTRAVRRQKKGAKKGASYRRLYIRVQASYRRLEKRRRLGAF